jgi:hypothetical protein
MFVNEDVIGSPGRYGASWNRVSNAVTAVARSTGKTTWTGVCIVLLIALSCHSFNYSVASSTDIMEPSFALILYAYANIFVLASADETPVGSLYASGQNISGLPLFYADGSQHHPRRLL